MAAMLPFKNFCFCADLKTGVAVLAWISLLLACTNTIKSTVDYANLHETTMIDDQGETIHFAENEKAYVQYTIWVAYGTLIMNIAFIYGVIKENTYFMLPWLTFTGCFGALFILVFGAFMFSGLSRESPLVMGYNSVIIVLTSAISVYLFLCVVSLYQKYSHKEDIKLSGNRRTTEIPIFLYAGENGKIYPEKY